MSERSGSTVATPDRDEDADRPVPDESVESADSDADTTDADTTDGDETRRDETQRRRSQRGEAQRGKTRRGEAQRGKTGGSTSEKVRTRTQPAQSIPSTIVEGVRNLLGRPLASYHLILAMAFLLTAFGLIMVLSASSVEGYSKEGSAYGLFATQVIFALLGFVVFYVMLRLPVRFLRRAAAPMMIATTILLALVLIPGIGTLSQGARRWFVIYGLSVQPSELVKVALCVWGAHLLASRRQVGASLRELLIPLVPVALLVCLLIILEPNLSTTITIAIIIGALLWFAGLSLRVFFTFAVAGVVMAVILALVEGYRSQRVMSFLGNVDDPQGAGYQARQAMFALANGGFFGEGLGQSRAKWNYLPNAHNDFIFAIIGEELGLIGGLLVVFLFVILAFIGFRIAARSTDPFLRLMSATITVLIIAQALINIGYVIGLLPVTGIQLPLLSAGGTSTLTVLAMLGLLANAARHEPEAVAALTTGAPSRMSRLLRLPTPVGYRQTRAESLRDRLDRERGDGRSDPRRAGAGRSGRDGRGNGAQRGVGSTRNSPIRVDYRVGYSGRGATAPETGRRTPDSRRATPGRPRAERGRPQRRAEQPARGWVRRHPTSSDGPRHRGRW